MTNQIEKTLDKYLKRARVKKGELLNVMFVAETCMGKTAMISKWAKKHEEDIHFYNLDAPNLHPQKLQWKDGIISDVMFSSQEVDNLNMANTVIFIDQFSMAKRETCDQLLRLVQKREVVDPREADGVKRLDNVLFIVIAALPTRPYYGYDYSYEIKEDTVIDDVEIVWVKQDKQEYLDYLTKTYSNRENWERRLSLAKALLTSENFSFDDAETITNAVRSLNYRTFISELKWCDIGTKDEFLEGVRNQFSNAKYEMIKNILADYQDPQ